MPSSLTVRRAILTVVCILTGSMLIGCSGGKNIQSQISGTWQRTQAEGTVQIDLVNDPNSMEIEGKTYLTSIQKVDKGTYSIYLNVEITDGQTEEWTLRQIWNDNGDSFKLAFRHNGTQETLEPGSPS